jgi:hypothetical protein
MRRYDDAMKRCRRVPPVFVVLAIVILLIAAAAGAQTREAIRYTVRFPAPHTNYLEVEAIVPTDGRTSVEMFMAVWTPGSYLVREYARNVEGVRATAAGRSATVHKITKNRWRITTTGAREIALNYRVYAHEMSVRTNWVDADFAVVNGAPTFMTLAPEAAASDPPYNRPHDVRLELPAGWKMHRTARRIITARPISTPLSIHRSSWGIQQCTASLPAASRTCWSMSVKAACSTAPVPPRISRASFRPTRSCGARCRTTSTSSSMC